MPWLCSGTQETWKPRNPRAQETQDSPPEACRKCHRVLPHCRYCWFNTWSTCPHSPRCKAACSRSWTCWEPCPALGQVPAQHPGAAFPRGQCGAYQVPCSSPCGRLYRCNVFFAWREFPSMLQTTEPLKMPSAPESRGLTFMLLISHPLEHTGPAKASRELAASRSTGLILHIMGIA